MTIDASIPLQAGRVFSLSEIMERAERVKGLRASRERAEWDWQQAKTQAERDEVKRRTLADLVLSQSPELSGMPSNTGGVPSMSDPAQPTGSAVPMPGGPMAAGPMGGAMGAPAAPAAPAANPWADYVRADPDGAVDYRATTAKWRKDEFDAAETLNEGVLQILSGVYDQPSYQRAKNKARALYGRFGVRLDDFNLPDEYSPELVRSIQMEAMTTKDQLGTLRAERKLEWDIEDDQADNERMDEREDDLSADRAARRNNARTIAERRDATTRRGQDVRAATARTPKAKAAPARPTATGPGGKKVEWNGKAWVPVK